jgi:excisionase family DNA binding protein
VTTTERRFQPGEDFDADEGVLTTAELADLYGVEHKTAARWGKLGRIPHVLTPGNHYRFSVAYHRRHLAAERG